MILFVENQSGSPFEIEVFFWDTVLDIKKEIVKTQRIPLHKQTLFFQGKVLEDDLSTGQCFLQHESRLQLFISPDHIPNLSHEQGRQPQQSPLPSNQEFLNFQYSHVEVPQTSNPPFWSKEEFLNFQDTPLQGPQTQNPPFWSNEELLNFQDSYMTFGIGYNSQVLQTEQYPVPSNSIESNLYCEDLRFAAEPFSNIQSWRATTGDIINQHSQMTMRSNNNPVLQTDQSPSSDSIREIINIPDSPVNTRKLRVLVTSIKYKWKIPVEVNENDNVEELWKELVEMQKRFQLNLPQEGCFIHREGLRVLDEHQSFQWNGVAHGDSIGVFSGTRAAGNRFLKEYKPDTGLGNFGRQGIQTDPSTPSNSIKEIINIPDSHVKKPNPKTLRVLVLPFSCEGRDGQKIPVVVNENDNIEVLRKELIEMQKRFKFNLPEVYFFISHERGILDEYKSFQWNRIAHGDTIVVLPGQGLRPS